MVGQPVLLFSVKLRWSQWQTPPSWPWRSPTRQYLTPSWPSLQKNMSPSQRNMEARSSIWTSSESSSKPPISGSPQRMVPSPSISGFQPSHHISHPPNDVGILEEQAGTGRGSLGAGGRVGAGRGSLGAGGGAGGGGPGYLPATWSRLMPEPGFPVTRGGRETGQGQRQLVYLPG